MSSTAPRFLHLSAAGLDRPIEGVHAGSEHRSAVEDATLDAFRKAIDTAIHRKTAFVLLTGSTFCEEDASLRARRELLAGLQRCQQRDILVVAVPNAENPAEAWDAIPQLPDNVILCPQPLVDEAVAEIVEFDTPAGQPVTLVLGNELQLADWVRHTHASRTVGEHSLVNGHVTNGHTNGNAYANGRGVYGRSVLPLTIGVMLQQPREMVSKQKPQPQQESGDDWRTRPSWSVRLTDDAAPPVSTELSVTGDVSDLAAGLFSYLALAQSSRPWGESARSLVGSVTVVPALVPRYSDQYGRHGAALVEMRRDGQCSTSLISCATIRRERFQRVVTTECTREELIEGLATALDQTTASDLETDWFVEWHIRGDGSVIEWLKTDEARKELAEFVALESRLAEKIRIHSRVRVQRDVPQPLDRRYDATSPRSWWQSAYREQAALSTAELTRRLRSRWTSAERDVAINEHDQHLLAELLAEANNPAVLAQAGEIGHDWFRDVQWFPDAEQQPPEQSDAA